MTQALRKYADCHDGGVYTAAPRRRNRNRDAMALLGAGPWDRLAHFMIAEEMRNAAEKIGRPGLRASLMSAAKVDQERMAIPPITGLYVIGNASQAKPGTPGATFPPRQPKRPMMVADIAPSRLPPIAMVIDDNRHGRRAWAAARDHARGLGPLWFQTFWHAMFDQYTLSQCARSLLGGDRGRQNAEVKRGFSGILIAAHSAMA